jgi:phage/plasmid-associated DNA primase
MSCVSLEKICNGGDELRHLESSLVNIGTEINQRLLDDTDVFNKMTCGERFNSALKYEKSRCLKPMCKHIFVGNHLPGWKRGSDAQARRMKILYFAEDFTDQRKDGQLERDVKLEGSGILNWMIEGLLEVVKLEQMPAGSKESQECAGSFKKHNNPIETFNRLACDLSGSAQMPMADYGRVFRFWCEKEGISFNRQVSKVLMQNNPKLKIKSTHVNGKRCRVVTGIRFNEEGQYLAAEAPMNFGCFND